MSPTKTRMELPAGVTPVKARGRVYWYWRPNRKAAQNHREKLISVRIHGEPTDPAFWEELERIGALDPEKEVASPFKVQKGTMAALVEAYQESAHFNNLADKTKHEYRRYHDVFVEMWRNVKVARIRPKHVLELQEANANTPFKANYMIKTLSALLAWGVPREYSDNNPCREVKALRTGDGWEPWSWDQINHFKAHAAPHIWAVAAFCLYTGQRISDVLNMKWTDIRNGMISVKQEKTGKPIFIPIHDDLQPVLDRLPRSSINILTNSRGVPWKSGWNAALRRQLDKPEMAPLREDRLVTHGLRKSACCFLAECECTDAEIQAITGHSKGMVDHYRKGVNQVKLAKKAILKFSRKEK